jgi:hypothetical protein
MFCGVCAPCRSPGEIETRWNGLFRGILGIQGQSARTMLRHRRHPLSRVLRGAA